MYFLTCFPFQCFFKRTGVRKHRWIGAGPVGAVRGRLRTALEIFRSLGRPQDAEGFFFWFGWVFFPFLLIDLECSPRFLSRFCSSSPASPAAAGNAGALGLGEWVAVAAPGVTPLPARVSPAVVRRAQGRRGHPSPGRQRRPE